MSKRKSSQTLLTDLFSKRAVPVSVSSGSSTSSEKYGRVVASSSTSTSSDAPPAPPLEGDGVKTNQPPIIVGKSSHPYDIGLYSDRVLSIFEKCEVLQNVWQPPSTYNFPILEKFSARKIKFQYSWFTEFPWIAYSEVHQGVFCKYCCLFAKHGVGVNQQDVGAFVKRKFDNWKKAKESFRNHESTQYHRNCVLDSISLEKVKDKSAEPIVNQIDQARHDAVTKNRSHLKPIIDAIILCGRQELALRGHRDSGNINMENQCSDSNEGNFRAILKYRSQGDKELMQVIEGPGKIKYMSPKIQNEIISSCNTIILNKLIHKINAAQGFSILADETSDISNVEQLSLCVRYVDVIEGQHFVKEDFLQFQPVTSMTGKSLAKNIIECLKSFGIDLNFLRGQGYDGAANMAGMYNGVHRIIQNDYPAALYVHCAAHALNLAVTKACEVQNIRNCLGVIEKVYTFLNTPKRQAVLKKCIEESNMNPGVKSVKRMSTTRWTSKYDSVQDFLHIMDFVIEALTTISSWKDGCDANTLKWAILNSEFIVSVHIVATVFSYCLPLCKTLQKESIDMKQMVYVSKSCITELQSLRQNAEHEFSAIFKCAESVAQDLEVEIKTPRVCGKQRNRSNILALVGSNDPPNTESYYRVNVFVPFLDFFINQLKERFEKHESVFLGFQCLFEPFNDSCAEKLFNLVQFYSEDMKSAPRDILIELKLWRNYIQTHRQGLTDNINSVSISNALDCCDATLYPNIYKLLKILCTLPVTTCTPERTFSTLKRIKTYLRNTTGQVRQFQYNIKINIYVISP